METLLVPPRPGPSGPLWLLAEVTYRCPLHCSFCYNPVDFAQAGPELSTDDWLSVIRQARAMGATLKALLDAPRGWRIVASPLGRTQATAALISQALGGVAEVGHDVLDDLFHAVEITEGGVELDDLVGEDARQAGVEPGVDQLRFGRHDGGRRA